jgi:hypothetical protein
MPSKPNTPEDADIRLELYKSLRAEITGYVEKVPALWLQKFVLVGGVIAFIVTNHGSLGGSGDLLIFAILAIPVLAILLDAKIGEYGLHARAASMFIRDHFADSTVATKWESTLWGDQGTRETVRIVKLRSLMTAVVTAVPTIILIIVAGLAIDEIHQRSHPTPVSSPTFFYLSLLGAIAYILGVIVIWHVIWRKLPGSASKPADRADR